MAPDILASVRQNLVPLINQTSVDPTCRHREQAAAIKFDHRHRPLRPALPGSRMTATDAMVYVSGPAPLSICSLGDLLRSTWVGIQGMDLDRRPGLGLQHYFHPTRATHARSVQLSPTSSSAPSACLQDLQPRTSSPGPAVHRRRPTSSPHAPPPAVLRGAFPRRLGPASHRRSRRDHRMTSIDASAIRAALRMITSNQPHKQVLRAAHRRPRPEPGDFLMAAQRTPPDSEIPYLRQAPDT